MFLGNEIDNALQKREQLIREYERRQARKRFNIIGFSVQAPYSNWQPTKHCVYHPGTRLIPNYDLETKENLPGLMCPSCGSKYSEKESPLTEEGIKSKHGKQKSKIISAKSKRKKYHDSRGNVINDPDLILIAQQGGNIISYHEEKQGEEYHTVKK